MAISKSKINSQREENFGEAYPLTHLPARIRVLHFVRDQKLISW